MNTSDDRTVYDLTQPGGGPLVLGFFLLWIGSESFLFAVGMLLVLDMLYRQMEWRFKQMERKQDPDYYKTKESKA